MDYGQDMAFGASLYNDASPDILGVPNAQADFWDMQEFADNCEPTAESFIIRQFGYDNISTNDFAYISHANGWYQPGSGTSPENMGDMMDLFGIGNHTNTDATIQDLAHELSQGHGVVVGVRSDQLWEQGPLQDLWNWIKEQFGFDTPDWSPADHAVSVTGIQKAEDGSVMVILNDPGDPLGAGHAYPLDRFMDAWENSSFRMTATNDPLPAFAEQLRQAESSGGIDWTGFANSVHEIAEPIVSIAGDVACVIGAVAGAVVSFNTLSDALSGDDYALWI